MKQILKISQKHNYILVMERTRDRLVTETRLLVLLLILSALFFTACAHNETKGCQELDWYEIGRQDGAKGLLDNQRRQVSMVCASSDESTAEALYNNGFDAGAAGYCTRKNGFELGRSHARVADVCPIMLKDEFQLGYRQGERLSDLLKEKSEIDRRLNVINERLNDSSVEIARRGLIKGEKIELESKAKNINSELQSLRERLTDANIN